MWRALASIELPLWGPLAPSLMTTKPTPGSGMVWVWLVPTVYFCPLIVTDVSAPALTTAPLFVHVAEARASRTSAPICWPATLRLKFATDASALLVSPPATTAAWSTSTLSTCPVTFGGVTRQSCVGTS